MKYLEQINPTCIGDLIDITKQNRVFIKASPNFIGIDYLIGSFRATISFVCLTQNKTLTIDNTTYDLRKRYYKLKSNSDAIELPEIINELMKG